VQPCVLTFARKNSVLGLPTRRRKRKGRSVEKGKREGEEKKNGGGRESKNEKSPLASLEND